MSSDHSLARFEALALVGIGGFAGANLRYLAAELAPGLPGTLAANVLGSFALGFVLYESIYTDLLAAEARTVLSTGFLSSFTTYSTFALQTAGASPPWMAANVLANYGLGFGAVLLGRRLAAGLATRAGTDVTDDDPPEATQTPAVARASPHDGLLTPPRDDAAAPPADGAFHPSYDDRGGRPLAVSADGGVDDLADPPVDERGRGDSPTGGEGE
jgi:CrcB protein